MKVLITGVCGFAGSTLALNLREAQAGLEICLYIWLEKFFSRGDYRKPR
jgi:nucleoside-diphosphate-sugar epimerase